MHAFNDSVSHAWEHGVWSWQVSVSSEALFMVTTIVDNTHGFCLILGFILLGCVVVWIINIVESIYHTIENLVPYYWNWFWKDEEKCPCLRRWVSVGKDFEISNAKTPSTTSPVCGSDVQALIYCSKDTLAVYYHNGNELTFWNC